MVVVQPDVQIRAWDLGGFGDIAGAMRTASHVQRGGMNAAIVPTSEGARKKLDILLPDVSVSTQLTDGLQVDVAGHYFDNRTDMDRRLVPHLYAEDMDNPSNRGDIVPIYLKTGLRPVGRQVKIELGGANQNPMFYRPFREWELPELGRRDFRKLVTDAMYGDGRQQRNLGKLVRSLGISNPFSGLQRVLERADEMAFGHFQPGISVEYFFNHPYVRSLALAATSYDRNFTLGLFFGKELENMIGIRAYREGYTIVQSNGEVVKGKPHKPTLVFLGQQPQMTTTSLFLSATMPNIVTGDLSLSDALYGLVAMDGPAFVYDCPRWKVPTFEEMRRILREKDTQTTDTIFTIGSTLFQGEDDLEFIESDGAHCKINDLRVRLFGDRRWRDAYTTRMRNAIRAEIMERFGPVPYYSGKDSEGLYIPRGAPFLFQDAVEGVLHTLADNPDIRAEVESARKRLGERAFVGVAADVMTPAKPMSIDVIYKPFKEKSGKDYSYSSPYIELPENYEPNHNYELDILNFSEIYKPIKFKHSPENNICKDYKIELKEDLYKFK